jgi:hypothetical protein
MLSSLCICLLAVLLVGEGEQSVSVTSLLDLLDSLHSPIEDFRCEFEGTSCFTGDDDRKRLKLGADGLYDTFSGTFIWKSNGDTYVNSLHRREPEGKITREQLVVRARQGESEYYERANDAPLGRGLIQSSSQVNAFRSECFGAIFPIDEIRRLVARKGIECSVSDDIIQGRRLKALSFSFAGINRLWQRYWIDLRRGGQTVRYEDYAAGNVLVSRVDITLRSFQVGDQEVWMPVLGVAEGHAALDKEGRPLFPKEPTSIERIYINAGTLEFNKRPGPETFIISYKSGTPISDRLRKLEYEFGQQKVPPRISKATAEAVLREQLANAEAQRNELEASSPEREGSGWTQWILASFATATLVLSLMILISHFRR